MDDSRIFRYEESACIFFHLLGGQLLLLACDFLCQEKLNWQEKGATRPAGWD